MRDLRQHRGAQSSVMNALILLSHTLAIAITFFLAPIVYDNTIIFVMKFTQRYHGSDLAELSQFIWMIVVVLTMYSIARIFTVVFVLTGGAVLIMRFI